MKTLLWKNSYLFLRIYKTAVLWIVKGRGIKTFDFQVKEEWVECFPKFKCFRIGEAKDNPLFGRLNFCFFSSEKFKKIAHINIDIHVMWVICETQARKSKS